MLKCQQFLHLDALSIPWSVDLSMKKLCNLGPDLEFWIALEKFKRLMQDIINVLIKGFFLMGINQGQFFNGEDLDCNGNIYIAHSSIVGRNHTFPGEYGIVDVPDTISHMSCLD